jgi:predicted dinucleotide-binding enzyme
MKVTIIGAGNMGSAFVKQLVRAGHEVSVTARDSAKAAQVAAAHPGAKAVAVAGAANGADAVVLATGYGDAAAALQAVGDLQGKVVIDITNPLTADYMGLTLGHSSSAAEEIAKAVPGAEVVKGFNTVFAQVLGDGADFGEGRKVTVFVASDSARAKQTATALAQSMGFEVVDAGGLKNARYLEPLAGLNIYLGYGAGLGTAIAPTWVHRA